MSYSITLTAKFGDLVYIKEIEAFARVKSVSIGHEGAQYELAWFSNGEKKTGWFFAEEFEARA